VSDSPAGSRPGRPPVPADPHPRSQPPWPTSPTPTRSSSTTPTPRTCWPTSLPLPTRELPVAAATRWPPSWAWPPSRCWQAAVDRRDRRMGRRAPAGPGRAGRPPRRRGALGRPRRVGRSPLWLRDHLITQAGTGLRPSGLLCLRRWRVSLGGARLENPTVRYDAGRKFGSGYKDRTKSVAGTRPVPLSTRPLEIVTRRVRATTAPDALIFAWPGRQQRRPCRCRPRHVGRELPPPL
jgi:hypothetical protein